MKTDYNSISFRNKNIDRLSGNTTKSPTQFPVQADKRKELLQFPVEPRNSRNGSTSEQRLNELKANEAAKKAMKDAKAKKKN